MLIRSIQLCLKYRKYSKNCTFATLSSWKVSWIIREISWEFKNYLFNNYSFISEVFNCQELSSWNFYPKLLQISFFTIVIISVLKESWRNNKSPEQIFRELGVNILLYEHYILYGYELNPIQSGIKKSILLLITKEQRWIQMFL